MPIWNQIQSQLRKDRAQNPGPTLALSDTCVAAVVAPNFPFHVLHVTGNILTHVAAFGMKPPPHPPTTQPVVVYSQRLCRFIVAVYADGYYT